MKRKSDEREEMGKEEECEGGGERSRYETHNNQKRKLFIPWLSTSPLPLELGASCSWHFSISAVVSFLNYFIIFFNWQKSSINQLQKFVFRIRWSIERDSILNRKMYNVKWNINLKADIFIVFWSHQITLLICL